MRHRIEEQCSILAARQDATNRFGMEMHDNENRLHLNARAHSSLCGNFVSWLDCTLGVAEAMLDFKVFVDRAAHVLCCHLSVSSFVVFLAATSADHSDPAFAVEDESAAAGGNAEDDASQVSIEAIPSPPTDGHENSAPYEYVSQNYHPNWYERTDGWRGNTYDEAVTFCASQTNGNEKMMLCR